MAIAAAITSRTADAPARSKPGRIASVEVTSALEQAEPAWRELESQFATPYQRFDLLNPWQRLVGAREGTQPMIVMAYDAEHRPLLLLPLAARTVCGVRIGCFMGGKHMTFNMGLWNAQFAARATVSDIGALLRSLGERRDIDVLALSRQPLRWRGLPNPFALLPHQASANTCPVLAMSPVGAPASRIGNSLRRRLKSKERKLQALPGWRYHRATSDAEINRLLDWFFRVKPLRMAEQRLPNVFAEPGVEDFIRTACLTACRDGRVIDIHALECKDEVLALFAGVADGHRFSMMFNTYTMSPNARYSPGLVLARNIVDHYSALGYSAIDLGIGSDSYKRLFCKSDEAIVDSFIPLSPRGEVAARLMSGANHAKRLIKRNDWLLALTRRLRRAF